MKKDMAKRIRGTILHAREILGTVRLEIEIGKASAASLFTGSVDYHRLRGKTAKVTVKKVDTRKEERNVLKQERIAKARARKIERKMERRHVA